MTSEDPTIEDLIQDLRKYTKIREDLNEKYVHTVFQLKDRSNTHQYSFHGITINTKGEIKAWFMDWDLDEFEPGMFVWTNITEIVGHWKIMERS